MNSCREPMIAARSIRGSTFFAARRAASFAALTTVSASSCPATAAVRPAAIAIFASLSVTVALFAFARNAFHIIWIPHGAAATFSHAITAFSASNARHHSASQPDSCTPGWFGCDRSACRKKKKEGRENSGNQWRGSGGLWVEIGA